ncbi:MAG: glycosyltransferase family 4 protein [Gaiellaceae bacterium]
MTERLPRVLFVGRTRYSLPLPEWLAKKFDALERQLDFRVLASAREAGQELASGRFRLLRPLPPRLLDGVFFYLRCPFAVRRQILDFRPEVIVAESPYTGAAALMGRALASEPRPRVLVEVHGDWRTATRLYGSPRRRVLSPLADWISRAVVRRGDAVRALSGYTEGLVEDVRGVPVTASFPTYTDLTAFTAEAVKPLPERPTAVFVGMLEPYKNIDGLAEVWRRLAPRLPEARLVLIGDGSRRDVAEELVAQSPESVEWHPALSPEDVARKLDEGTALVLPSRSEGLGRVIIEAFARGRGVVASDVGGIPDLVRDEVEGLLVDPTDLDGIAAALERVLTDRELAERLGAAAHARYREWHTTPGEYASRMRALVEASLRDVGAVKSARTAGDPALAALREEVDYCVLGRAERGPPHRPAVAPGSVRLARRFLFWPLLPFRVAALVRRFRPEVVIAETPHLAFMVLVGLALRRRRRPRLVVETYGDWRAEARLSGARARALLSPLADWAARYALRRADALHALSPVAAQVAQRAVRAPLVESFPAYTDLSAFRGRPVQPFPDRPSAIFVGMLERSKDLGTLAEAWRLVAAELPEARLKIVGRGALVDVVERLRDDYPESVTYVPELAPPEVARALDESTLLVLPSRSEGLGRVIVESFARGRPVVATRVGGIPDLVEDGVNGLLVPPGDPARLAEAMANVLSNRQLAERLAAGATEAAASLRWTPDEYASRVRRLVERTLATAGR